MPGSMGARSGDQMVIWKWGDAVLQQGEVEWKVDQAREMVGSAAVVYIISLASWPEPVFLHLHQLNG